MSFYFGSGQSSWQRKKLSLQAAVLNTVIKRSQCNPQKTAHITLEFVNASVPQCPQTDFKELCFPHIDASNPHVRENRFPGALRQLRQLTRLNACPNYTVSYSVESGEDPLGESSEH